MGKKNKKQFKTFKPVKLPARFSFLGYMGDVQGCGTIRVIIPYLLLNHYRSYKNKVTCLTTFLHNYVPEVDFYKNFSFVQFQRSATDHHLEIFKHFRGVVQKKYNLPLVYEIDDMLIDIPDWNYASKYYKAHEDNVKNLLRMSNAVMCSTDKLANMYSKYNENVHVVPNHLAKFIWGDLFPAHEYYEDGTKIKILWGGSQNHFHNSRVTGQSTGGDFTDKLLDFVKKTTEVYDWYFVGALPEPLTGIMDKIHYIPWVDVFHYPKVIKDIEPDIGIAPLLDNEFNACKSNIKQLEYVAAGCAGIYSNVEPYKNCYLKVKNDEEMIEWINKLASDIDLRAKVWSRDKERVRMQLFWEDNDNLKKYVNTYLRAFGQKLP